MTIVHMHRVIDGPEQGEPIVLLHGYPLDHTMWEAQSRYLAGRGYRVIRPDLRGHGKSPVAGEASTMERCTDDLLDLADRLGLSTFRLGGLSMGGYIALQFARTHPERLTALLLSDARAEPDTPEGKEKRLGTIETIRTKGMKPVAEAMLPQLLSEQSRRQRSDLAPRVRATIERMAPQGAIDALRGMMERPDQRPHLDSIRVPTLIVVGAEDNLTPPESSRFMSQKILNSQLRIVTGAAHLTPLEQPEPFNHFLDHWLRGFKDKPRVPSAFAGAQA